MMKRQNLWWVVLLLMILFLSATTLQAQSRAIRPVNIQIPNEGKVQLYEGSYALVIGVSVTTKTMPGWIWTASVQM